MEVTFKGTAVATNAEPTAVGAQLPLFTVVDETGQEFGPQDFRGKITLISVVPDINTRVCSLSTKKFNQDVDEFPGVNFLTISTNTPDQQKDWCAAEGVQQMKLLSDAGHSFGKAMGLYIQAKDFDARSVWVLNAEGDVIYREIVPEISSEPDYQAALDVVRSLTV